MSVNITMRVPIEVKETLQKNADACNMNLTEFILEMISLGAKYEKLRRKQVQETARKLF